MNKTQLEQEIDKRQVVVAKIDDLNEYDRYIIDINTDEVLLEHYSRLRHEISLLNKLKDKYF